MTVLNANNFFLNRSRRSAAALPAQSIWWHAWAGPILKDQLWFFVSYQGSREVNGTSLLNSIGTVFVPRQSYE